MRKPAMLALFLVVMSIVPQGWARSGANSAADAQFEPKRRKDPVEIQQEKDQEKARNLQRQRDLKRDTEKLLELATELKQYVDRTNESTLSLEVVNKAEEIEKLAKSVKNKMKGP